jgi:hypothetical protein
MRQITPERGFQFVTEAKELIEGPKTQEEAEEEEKMVLGMMEYMAFRNQHCPKVEPKVVTQAQKTWTPRWEGIEVEEEEQVPVKVHLEEFGDTYDWILRKGMEWLDFRYLVNSKMGHDNWEAITNNVISDGVPVNGMVYKPSPGQEITVSPSWFGVGERRTAIFKEKQEAWDRISETYASPWPTEDSSGDVVGTR